MTGIDPNAETLLSRNYFCIERKNDITTLNVFGNWTKSVEKAASRFRIKRLVLNVSPAWIHLFPKVLKRFPELLELSVTGCSKLEWNCIESLQFLKFLCLQHLPEKNPQPRPINFGLFSSLTGCVIDNWQPAWVSVTEARYLRRLSISSTMALQELDCTNMRKLERLEVLGCPKLRRIKFPMNPRIRQMEINSCYKLEVDWKVAGHSLQKLSINGRFATPLDQLVHADQLKRLMIFSYRGLPKLGFLRRIPSLNGVSVFGKVSKSDRSLIHSINLRNPIYAKKLRDGLFQYSEDKGLSLVRTGRRAAAKT